MQTLVNFLALLLLNFSSRTTMAFSTLRSSKISPWRRSTTQRLPTLFATSSLPNDNTTTNNNNSKPSWKTRILEFSNFASFLCILDCTVLPIITLGLPLVGMVGGNFSHSCNALSHQLALYFVLPVGGLATTTNYFWNHSRLSIASLGVLGLLCVWSANVGHFFVWNDFVHRLHHGWLHRAINLAGCACLLASNWLSKRQHADGACCGHDHDSHEH